MDGETRLGLPGESLDKTVARDRDRLVLARHPTNGVPQQAAEIGVPGVPQGAVNVAGEIDQAALALFAKDHGGLVVCEGSG